MHCYADSRPVEEERALVSDLLARLVGEHRDILASLRTLLAPQSPAGRGRSVQFKDLQQKLLAHFEVEERNLAPLLLTLDCSHARGFASGLPLELIRLRQLLTRVGALAWSRRRAAQALAEFARGLGLQFDAEERGIFDEARRHLKGHRVAVSDRSALATRPCHGP